MQNHNVTNLLDTPWDRSHASHTSEERLKKEIWAGEKANSIVQSKHRRLNEQEPQNEFGLIRFLPCRLQDYHWHHLLSERPLPSVNLTGVIHD